jgi:hypothetical protein
VAQISKAGHGLLKFVETVVAYCGIYREVKPKRDRVAQMEREFEKVRGYCKPQTGTSTLCAVLLNFRVRAHCLSLFKKGG